MRSIARFVLRHRKRVMVGWAVLFIAGVAGSSSAVNRMSTDFSLPGQPGYETATKVLRSHGISPSIAPYLLVVTAPAGQAVNVGQADATFAAVQRAVPTTLVIGHAQTGDGVFVTKDQRSTFAYAFIPLPKGFTNDVITQLQTALSASAPAAATATFGGV